MIAVCGANGTMGRRVVATLQRHGANVRALVRTAQEKSEPGVEFVPVDLSKKEVLERALKGADNLFLLTPNGAQQLEMELSLIEAAAANGVKRIVKLSMMGATPHSPIEFARLHGSSEEAIRACGCAWTFIRSNMFMQNLLWYKDPIQSGALPLPLGEAAVSHVDADDVGEAAALALLDEKHAGKIYTLTGPEALTGAAVASILSTVLGKIIEYRPMDSSDFRAYLKSTGESDSVVDAEVELFSYWSQEHGSDVTSDVAAVTGSRAITLEEFARKEKDKFL